LCEGISRNSALKRLDLSGNMLGDAGAGWVADMLAANSTLQELSLEGNWIGREGAVEIADALPANSSLSLLHLGDCPDFVPDDEDYDAIDADGVLAIGRALRARPRTIHKINDGSYRDFILTGTVDLAEVAAELGLPAPDAGAWWSNKSILAFFWEQHERRLAVCMLAHGRLGKGSRWARGSWTRGSCGWC